MFKVGFKPKVNIYTKNKYKFVNNKLIDSNKISKLSFKTSFKFFKICYGSTRAKTSRLTMFSFLSFNNEILLKAMRSRLLTNCDFG